MASGVFDEVSSFSELEHKIELLSRDASITNPSLWKGDVFEVFCEALLLSNPIFQAKRVWAKSNLIPSQLAEKLRLRPKDKGVDGLFETIDGRYISYQSKFYPARSMLYFGDLGNFFGLSDRVDEKLVISNCTEIDQETQDREPQFFGKTDLESLSIEDWLRLNAVLTDKAEPKGNTVTPDPHQKNAIQDCLLALKDTDRFQFISACGTGKTLTSLWIAEEYRPKTVLYLLPSLALVEQTLTEWIKHAKSHFPFMSVCSDVKTTSYAEDELAIKRSDLPFAATTEPKKINIWLNATEMSDFRVVFGTYESAKKIALGSPDDFIFDLAFFDEAHKTAGKVGKKFTYALSDENISIAKRIFMTATPKIISIRKNSDGEMSSISMDDIDIYGPVKHRLNFSMAAKAGVVVPFKIIISEVDKAEIDAQRRKVSVTEVEDELVFSEHVAHQIALKQAQKKSGAKKILTFHRKVKDAEMFVDQGPIGVRQHINNFNCFSVKGEMNTKVRKRLLMDFAASHQGIISNARCLTEGVDVPEIDLVYFSHAKRSSIDVAQAVGRAIRKPRGNSSKQFGYIVIPLFLERHQNESLSEAVARSDFTTIAEVINRLRDQDDNLDELLQNIRVQKGRGRGINYTSLKEHISFAGNEIELDLLQNSILAEIVDRLTPTWDEWFGQLITFLEEYGHPPEIQDKKHRAVLGWTLADWCGHQRTNFNSGRLSEKRVKRLEGLSNIGWSWDPVRDRMISMSELIKDYCKQRKIWHVSENIVHNGVKLGEGAKSLKQSYHSGNLPEPAQKNLELISGWAWEDVDQIIWQLKFERYKKWMQRNKKIMPDRNIVISDIYGIEPYKLGAWINQQVSKYRGKKGTQSLTDDQVNRFETEIPFWAWDSWERSFKAYKKAIELLGLDNVKVNTRCEEFPKDVQNVGRWMSKQRDHCKVDNFRKSTNLEFKNLLRLEKAGFVYDPFMEAWHRGYQNLKLYVQKNKTSKVPQEFIADDGSELGSWVGTEKNKKEPSDFDGRLRRLSLERLPNWFENWADKRTVNYQPATDAHIKNFLQAFEGHQELNTFLFSAIFAGLRIHEIHQIELKKIYSVNAIEVPSSRGVSGFRLIPIHRQLEKFSLKFLKTKAAIKKAFADKKPSGMSKEIADTSLVLRFLEEFKKQKPSYKLETLVVYGGEPDAWTEEIMTEFKEKINRISYPL